MQDYGGVTQLMPGSVGEVALVVVGSTIDDRNTRAQVLFAVYNSVPNKASNVSMVNTSHISTTMK